MTLVEKQPAGTPRPTGSSDPKTVLLLDDDASTLLVLHAVLERTEARVIECEDESCTERWCNELQGIDVIVADVILQRTNGPAVVKKVRPLQPQTRLLFISGFSLPDLDRRGLLHDCDLSPGRAEFLQKPFTPDQFLGAVERLMAGEPPPS